jgi:aminopeptidase N
MIKNIVIFLTLVLVSCTGTKEVVKAPELIEERFLDTMVVFAPRPTQFDTSISLPEYRSSARRTSDLLHTKLELSFDWEKQYVLGIAELAFTPVFYDIDAIVLDAVGFDIHSISNKKSNLPLDYKYDGYSLTILLDRLYSKDDSFEIVIDYTAKPNETPAGGSSAITSEKGLFFINPSGKEAEKPTQIWTQGETENNSRWFPTFDKPNERCTQETIITVDEKYKTLTNGILKSSVSNPDGTRTDSWSMNQPHAPYLFMLAIGDFAVVEEKWEGIPVSYFVEPEYEEHAKEIFNHTPEMLSFFSDYTGLKYPWDKYAQVIVRDYVSGAMENTTAVIFGDFVQKTKRELIDDSNDYIVAHEMFHHWFGDYVTCESWSNLTMNEGFANYSEYLWTEYKYGKHAADQLRFNELRGYLNATQNGGTHDLIDFHFSDKEEMFDAHSYNKGGLILHMLRNHVGDKAFRKALNLYLIDNALSAVEAHHLRLAFEEVTGEDLNWFFNQWYFDKGHPELEIEHGYSDGIYTLTVHQVQDTEDHASIFQLPIDIDFYFDAGQVKRKKVWINERSQILTFEFDRQPDFVNFDAENIILGTKKEALSLEQQIYQYAHCKSFQDRYDALSALRGEPQAKQIFINALDDDFYAFRRMAITQVNPNNDILINKLKNLALNDPKSQVRTAALNKLSNVSDPSLIRLAEKVLAEEQAYPTISAGLGLLYEINPEKGLMAAESLMSEHNYDLVSQLSEIFSNSENAKYSAFYQNKIKALNGYNLYSVFGSYYAYCLNLNVSEKLANLDFLEDLALKNASNFKRFMAANTINNIKQTTLEDIKEAENTSVKEGLEEVLAKADNAIKEILETEKDPQLLQRFQSF